MRIIEGVSHAAYAMLCADLTGRFANVVIPSEIDLVDVHLNDDVIVKAYEDVMILYLGSNKSLLERDEFVSFKFI